MDSKTVFAANSKPYELFILGLSLYAIGQFVVEAFAPVGPGARAVLALADFGICLVFLADFARSVWMAPSRWRYLLTWGWLDFLSAVPTLPFLRLARAARVLRIVRVLRAVRSTRNVVAFATHKRAESAAYVAAFLCLLLVITGSAAVLHVELAATSPIRTPGDALWWAIGTVGTVGYRDLNPVTAEGRVIGVVLMAAGIALFGTLTGLLTSWFMAPEQRDQSTDLEALLREVRELRSLVEDRVPAGRA